MLTTLALAGPSAACNSDLLLRARFNGEAAGQPPAMKQEAGTVKVVGNDDSVQVVASPPAVSPTSQGWARIEGAEASLIVQCTRTFGVGRWDIVASVYIPSGTGTATMRLEALVPETSGADYLTRLDFLPDGKVYADDQKTAVDEFPHDRPFLVLIRLIASQSANGAEARIRVNRLAGPATVVPVAKPRLVAAFNFGAIRFSLAPGAPGAIYVDDIEVYRDR